MPRVTGPNTALAWASERAIDLWAIYGPDLAMLDARQLAGELASTRADGARIALLVTGGTDRQHPELGGLTVRSAMPPSPAGLHAALAASGVADVRRLGLLAVTPASIEAGHRAGVAAIVALRTDRASAAELSAAAPDAIVGLDGLAALIARRYGSKRERRPLVLLNPGPSVVSDRVHRAVGGPDLCHREPEAEALLGGLRAALRRVAGIGEEWSVILLSGSGTAAMEAMVGGGVRPGRRLLVCRNGIYGERLATIAGRLGIETVSVVAADVEPIDPAEVDRALATDPEVDAVAVVHHETTTGLLNPVHEIAGVARARGVPVMVDAISSFGAEELRLDEGIDWMAGTANKCLHGLPGMAFVLASPRAVERVRSVPPRSLYLDLATYLEAEARGSVPFTPALPAAYALEAALEELEELGVAARRSEYLARMAALDEGLAELGLEPRVAGAHRSASIRSMSLPPGVSYDDLHAALKRDGYVIYAGIGKSARSTFRICALGAIDPDAIAGVVDALHRAAGALTPGSAVSA